MTDVREAAERWASTWQRCWEALDPDPIVALYAEDATFSSHPSREAHRGRAGLREYVEGAFGDESDVRTWFGEPIVDGQRAAVSWWAALLEAGEDATLAGTSVLRFDADGLVADQWDAWHLIAGRNEPPDGWGR